MHCGDVALIEWYGKKRKVNIRTVQLNLLVYGEIVPVNERCSIHVSKWWHLIQSHLLNIPFEDNKHMYAEKTLEKGRYLGRVLLFLR